MEAMPKADVRGPGAPDPANWEQTVICIDLKSFYASVECVDRGLDPFTTDLVVADPTRSANTICLAATPSIKAKGVSSRSRLGQIPDGLEYLVAVPRMRRYMEASAAVVRTYLGFVAPCDLHVYSIDESFIDATSYLRLYGCSAHQLARRMMRAVMREHGLAATAGIGPNMFLAKVALDICAKHAPDGIGLLDQQTFRHEMWFHRPITDFWGIGPGIQRRLARYGVQDLAGVCALRPDTLRREFGVNAEYLIDHAWGLEPCTVSQARAWQPRSRSLSNGQVLMRNYAVDEARTVLKEMAHQSALRLVAEGRACAGVGVWVSYAQPVLRVDGREAWGASAARKLPRPQAACVPIESALLDAFDDVVDATAQVRRIGVELTGLMPAQAVQPTLFEEDPEGDARARNLADAEAAVQARFGANALLRGTSYMPAANARERNCQVGGHRA